MALVFVTLSPASRAQGPQRGEKYALLVGVKTYDANELRGLRYAEADIVDLAGVLRRGGYKADNVVVMTGATGAENLRFLPTADRIRKELKLLTQDCKPDDSVIVALDGQGIQFRDGPETYFCPADAKLANKSTLIPFDEIFKVLEKSPAGFKLVLLDVSHRDPQSENSRARSGGLLESVARPQGKAPAGGVAALFSCAADEEAYEHVDLKHSVFFHYVIEGLAGAAAGDEGRGVTLAGLEPFVRQEVSGFVRAKYGERQMPGLVGTTARSLPIAMIGEGQRAIRKARSLVEAGEVEKAVAALTEALRVNPALSAARVERAFLYNGLKRYDEANSDAAEAMRVDPRNPDLRLTGAWYGTYFYPDNGVQQAPVRFRLNIVQNGAKVSANVKEPNTFWESNPAVARDAPFLYAFCSGQYDPATRELKFTKTYDGAAGASHSVEYSGVVSEDGRKVEGTWNIGGFAGTFKAQMAPPGKHEPDGLN
jgi:tetratricopeptide (TPR) repeat protein